MKHREGERTGEQGRRRRWERGTKVKRTLLALGRLSWGRRRPPGDSCVHLWNRRASFPPRPSQTHPTHRQPSLKPGWVTQVTRPVSPQGGARRRGHGGVRSTLPAAGGPSHGSSGVRQVGHGLRSLAQVLPGGLQRAMVTGPSREGEGGGQPSNYAGGGRAPLPCPSRRPAPEGSLLTPASPPLAVPGIQCRGAGHERGGGGALLTLYSAETPRSVSRSELHGNCPVTLYKFTEKLGGNGTGLYPPGQGRSRAHPTRQTDKRAPGRLSGREPAVRGDRAACLPTPQHAAPLTWNRAPALQGLSGFLLSLEVPGLWFEEGQAVGGLLRPVGELEGHLLRTAQEVGQLEAEHLEGEGGALKGGRAAAF